MLRAARYLGVAPWDLLDRPVLWQDLALIAEWCEGKAAEDARSTQP